MTETQPTKKKKKPTPPVSLLDRRARRSAAMLWAERLWRLSAALCSLVLVFLALSWAGLWIEAAALSRMAGVMLFLLAALGLVAREIWRGAPNRAQALARLDAEDRSGLRPAASLDDRLADDRANEATLTLWARHRQNLERALAATPIAPPNPELPRRDPYALRLAALLAAIGAGFLAGDDKTSRLAAAFDWRGAAYSFQSERFDAYLDPPPYTGRAQIMLSGAADAGETREAPINSVLHVRPAAAARVEGALAPLAPAQSGVAAADERSFKLTGPARLIAPGGGAYALAAIPDHPPTI